MKLVGACEVSARQTQAKFVPDTAEILIVERITSMCSFHFCQCVNRKMQDLGLSATYITCKFVNRFVRQLCALCMLPVDMVQRAFEQVCLVLPSLDLN